MRQDVSTLTDDRLFLFNEGSRLRPHETLGAHLFGVDGTSFVHFAVCASDADGVLVVA